VVSSAESTVLEARTRSGCISESTSTGAEIVDSACVQIQRRELFYPPLRINADEKDIGLTVVENRFTVVAAIFLVVAGGRIWSRSDT
jgi:hypothetical protein